MNPVLAALKTAAALTPLNQPRLDWFHAVLEKAQDIIDTAGAEHFAEFWKLYPNKVAKDVARRAWVKMEGDTYWPLIQKNIQFRLRSNEWNPLDVDRRRFIPHASTYLNQRRWLDPMTVERTGAHRDF
jgi:hypothetical protein